MAKVTKNISLDLDIAQAADRARLKGFCLSRKINYFLRDELKDELLKSKK